MFQQISNDAPKCDHKFVGIREISEDGQHTIVGGEDTVRTYSYKEKYCLQCLVGLEIVDDADIQSV